SKCERLDGTQDQGESMGGILAILLIGLLVAGIQHSLKALDWTKGRYISKTFCICVASITVIASGITIWVSFTPSPARTPFMEAWAEYQGAVCLGMLLGFVAIVASLGNVLGAPLIWSAEAKRADDWLREFDRRRRGLKETCGGNLWPA